MSAQVEAFVDLLSRCSLKDLKFMSTVLASHIEHTERVENNPSLLIDYEPDFEIGEALTDVYSEVESLMAENKSTLHTTSQWLASDGQPYSFGSKTYHAKDINKYPSILKLMKDANTHIMSTSDMNCCLVNRYDSGKCAGRLHADDEKNICQSSSICTVSLGPDRTVVFRKNSSTPPVKSLVVSNGSIFFMRPGCQSMLKHKVNKGDPGDGVRYSISFRKAVTPIAKKLDGNTCVEPDDTRTPVVLIAGSSITKRLDADKLGKGRVKVVNISVGGNTFHKTQATIEDYYNSNKDSVNVTKLFVTGGCNDIRYLYSRGVRHLKAPITRLMLKIRELFPNAEVYFHSVLPNRIVNRWTVDNVVGVNNLIRGCCSMNKIYYLNFFGDFLRADGERNDNLFEDDVHPKRSSMGIFARRYIKLIHYSNSLKFNSDACN